MGFYIDRLWRRIRCEFKKKTEEEYVHKNFHGKNVVDGVKYKVRKEKNEEDEDDEE